MKFYVEIEWPFTAQRRAHILKNADGPTVKSWCRANLNPQKWTVVEVLPEDIHLCITCKLMANFPGDNRELI
jgi:hypothetical protein